MELAKDSTHRSDLCHPDMVKPSIGLLGLKRSLNASVGKSVSLALCQLLDETALDALDEEMAEMARGRLSQCGGPCRGYSATAKNCWR